MTARAAPRQLYGVGRDRRSDSVGPRLHDHRPGDRDGDPIGGDSGRRRQDHACDSGPLSHSGPLVGGRPGWCQPRPRAGQAAPATRCSGAARSARCAACNAPSATAPRAGWCSSPALAAPEHQTARVAPSPTGSPGAGVPVVRSIRKRAPRWRQASAHHSATSACTPMLTRRSVPAELGALAYTVGRDVFFGAGRYQPTQQGGRRLLAHELTHVLQQASRSGSIRPGLSSRGDPAEQQAEQVATRLAAGASQVGALGPVSPASVQRAEPEPTDETPRAPVELPPPEGSHRPRWRWRSERRRRSTTWSRVAGTMSRFGTGPRRALAGQRGRRHPARHV